ncbi:transposase [Amycolatopsis sp. cmx-4-61]|uniref:transposase n=1 Tax=Amycolatopsis sp. cmx-4-61 TaxID=2790937 RepID=UPI003979262F
MEWTPALGRGVRRVLADLPIIVLVRMRSARVLHRSVPPQPPGTMGKHRHHGDEFAFGAPATWGQPDTVTDTTTRNT